MWLRALCTYTVTDGGGCPVGSVRVQGRAGDGLEAGQEQRVTPGVTSLSHIAVLLQARALPPGCSSQLVVACWEGGCVPVKAGLGAQSVPSGCLLALAPLCFQQLCRNRGRQIWSPKS